MLAVASRREEILERARIEAEAAEASMLAVAARREEILAKARAEAASATAESAGIRAKMLADARGRFESTVNSVASSLEG